MVAPARILLIDDEALVREELGGLLADEGHVLVTASDGDEGLAQFRLHRPQMVITDVRMPRRDGLSMATAIRKEDPSVPITVITGHGTEDLVLQALRAGVVDFIKKPVRLDDLLAALDRMEAARRLTRRAHVSLPTSVRVVERAWTFRLENDLDAIADFIEVLLDDCAKEAEAQARTDLSLALRELLVNAIEHGNLGLSYEDKAQALQRGKLEVLLAERAATPSLRDRTVLVTARRQGDELAVQIRDQGEGFDWHAVPDPTDPANLLSAHGRGVLLARMSVDLLSYNERGNEVVIRKRLGERAAG